jgi:hypothetical protein
MKGAPSKLLSRAGESLENRMMGAFGAHVAETANTIFRIKAIVFELMQLRGSISPPLLKYGDAQSIIRGSKRNIEDLKRVEELLKGYVDRDKPSHQLTYSNTQNRNAHEPSRLFSLSSTENRDAESRNWYRPCCERVFPLMMKTEEKFQKRKKVLDEGKTKLEDSKTENRILNKETEQLKGWRAKISPTLSSRHFKQVSTQHLRTSSTDSPQ